MSFAGWPEEALEFFEGLEADNSKAYWREHKAVYDDAVRGPMDALLAELAEEFGEGKVFRPYRDVRFSADKSPYKTHMGATLEAGGYVQLSARGLGAGSGMYQMAPDQLERFRAAVDDARSGAAAERIAKKLRASGAEITAHGSLKTAPRGYPKDHPRIELLRLKGLIAWKEWDVEAWLGTRRAKERIATFLRSCRPLNDWLAEHVGASRMEHR